MPSQKLIIKTLLSDDEKEQCARMMAGSEPWLTLRRSHDHSIKLLSCREKEIYAAMINEQVAGFITINMKGSFTGYIQTICVAAEYRNQKIGEALMDFAERRIFRESPNVFVCVSSFNIGAKRFYDRLGYEEVGELKNYIIDGHSELLLRKTIAPIDSYNSLK